MIDFPLFIIALLTSLLLTPLARRLGLRLGIFDTPGELSIHACSVPCTGGLAMLVGFLVAVGYAWATGLAGLDNRMLTGVLLGSGLAASAGLLDDLKRVSPLQRIVWQLFAATIAVGFGVEVKTFPLAGAGILLAFFCLVGGANALNLLDGMDGLAAGTTAIAALFLCILAAGKGNPLALMLAMAVLGTTLGFLPYNWGILNFRSWSYKSAIRNPQSAIFMGDCGSLFLGFILSSIAILLANQPYDLTGFIAPLVVIAVPILDTALAILRRLSHRADPFGGDRQHIYDLLASAGLGNRRAVLVIYAATAMLGTLSLIIVRLDPLRAILLAGGVVVAMGLIAIRLGAVGASGRQSDVVRQG